MARDKTFEWRMQGMIYAYNIAKKDGVEALGKDIKQRGLLNAPLKFTDKQIKEFWSQLSQNLYINMLTTMAYTLSETFGFGKIRLQRLEKEFDQNAQKAMDLDWMGEHYVKLEDYAIELNDKYDMGLDVARIAACQDAQDHSANYTGRCKVDRVIEELTAAGYKEAAGYLAKKLGGTHETVAANERRGYQKNKKRKM